MTTDSQLFGPVRVTRSDQIANSWQPISAVAYWSFNCCAVQHEEARRALVKQDKLINPLVNYDLNAFQS